MSKFLMGVLLLFVGWNAASAHILPDTLSGSVKGTSFPNHTYYIKDTIVVNAGDSVYFSAGDTIIFLNPLGWIDAFGSFYCVGSAAHPNLITVPAARRTGPGQWGGIEGDSCRTMDIEYTTLEWPGGNDATGHARRTVDVYSDYQNITHTKFWHNTILGTVDDAIGLHGGTASVMYNTIKWCGAPDGDNINVKQGTWGEIAYNTIWSPGGSGIKLNSKNGYRLTNMCVHNNTITDGGWRRLGEPGYAILVDASARAQIYNNLMGDMLSELVITAAADTANTVYDNNLFFGSVDSLEDTTRFYPPLSNDGVTPAIGHRAPHDIYSFTPDAFFVSYQAYLSSDYYANDGENNYELLAGSAPAGHGITPSISWTNPYFSGQLPGDPNIGAQPVLSTPAGSFSDTLSGVVHGTMLANHTYYVKDSLVVNVGDSVYFSAGDTIIFLSPLGWIDAFGSFYCVGNAAHPNLITVPAARRTGPGQWGGIEGDSCRTMDIEYTTLEWPGGNDATGHARRTVDVYSDINNVTHTKFWHNTIQGTVDDAIGVHGGTASILYNTIKWCGAPDGDNINIKQGAWGEIAYNTIWSPGGSGIKLNSKNGFRLTNMCVHNNTITDGGWRRLGEPGYAILVDASARAQIYNNLMGDMLSELVITAAADTANTVYGNNLFFGSVDSLEDTTRFYPPLSNDGVTPAIGHRAAGDIYSFNPDTFFVSYQAYLSSDYYANDGENDYHLLPHSLPIAAGITPPISWTNPYFAGQLPGDTKIGAESYGGAAVGINIVDGWNLISIPVQEPQSIHYLFPVAASEAFSFSAGYVSVDTVTPGLGYWFKSSDSGQVGLNGTYILNQGIAVKAGWNMIGSLSNSIPAIPVGTVSGGDSVETPFYAYANGYTTPGTLEPGKGYWVKMKANGTLNLVATPAASPKAGSATEFAGMHHVSIQSGKHKQTIYLCDESALKAPITRYELPPVPPKGAFDLRFSSGRMLETYPSAIGAEKNFVQVVNFQSPTYPVTVEYDLPTIPNASFSLTDGNGGKLVSATGLSGSGKITVTNSKVTSLVIKMVEGSNVPKEFALSSAYPNPFNPTTRFNVSVPHSSKVTVSVYNVLGQMVATIFDAQASAGVHTMEWNARNAGGSAASSGVYFVRMTTPEFTGVQKVMLLK